MLMLKELSIRQFAIIEELRLQFEHGFHVLTGETGAGKSILIDALGLVVGGRASTDFVRHGADKAEIEAIFELVANHPAKPILTEWGMEEEESVIIRREITAGGKSTCRINGRTVTLAMLSQLGSHLLDISGQHENQSLLQVEEHLEWLDQFGGESLLAVRQSYQQLFEQYQQLKRELQRLNSDQKEIVQRIDLLQFQGEEIGSAKLMVGEDVELEQERNRLAYAEKLINHSSSAYEQLYGDGRGLDQLQQALSHLEEILKVDESLTSVHEIVQTSYYQLEEAVRKVARYRDELEFDPDRLEEVEERLHLIKQLKRKYGETISDIIKRGEEIQRELDQLDHSEENQVKLQERLGELRQQLLTQAQQLTMMRKEVATQLEGKVETELKELNMKDTLFQVAFHEPTSEEVFTATGQDNVEFLIAPNPGEPPRPLAKIASGGELSRIMLALKCIFTDIEQVHTLVFDEVDTGVSGRAAQAIAEKIAVLAMNHQVLCVTHLPQVACMADYHFYISKETQAEKTRTNIKSLTNQGRILELARLMGGVEVTQTTCEHAEEMLRLSNQAKKTIRQIKKAFA